ncbi:hypothetical protein Bca4012_051910 [Brassica carinata]
MFQERSRTCGAVVNKSCHASPKPTNATFDVDSGEATPLDAENASTSPADRDGSFTGAVYEDRDDKHRITWIQTLCNSQPNGDGVRAHVERLKLARAEEATGPPSHQSKGRKSLTLPEAEQARADLNESDGNSFSGEET